MTPDTDRPYADLTHDALIARAELAIDEPHTYTLRVITLELMRRHRHLRSVTFELCELLDAADDDRREEML